MIRKQRQRHAIAGFTLIEVLVALVVITVGMLGVAVLYVEGLRLNRTSLYRTTAVALATDMAERIRSNPDVTYEGLGRPGANGNCDVAACTPEQLAEDDWWRWRQAIEAYLPNGAEAEIEIDNPAAGPGSTVNRFDISLRWPEIGSPDRASYTLTVQIVNP